MMTKEEIIEMAKQCTFTRNWEYEKCLVCNPDSLYHFAKLIAQKEREECVKRASIALLGTLTTTTDRVLKAIRARGQA